MTKYHDSGTICTATKRPCRLGLSDGEHIVASSRADFEVQLAAKMEGEAVVPLSWEPEDVLESGYGRAQETMGPAFANRLRELDEELATKGYAQALRPYPQSLEDETLEIPS